MIYRLWKIALVFAAAAVAVCAGADLSHSRLAHFRARSPLIERIIKSARYAASTETIYQYLYDQYAAGKATPNEIWDAIECFKLTALPKLSGVDARYAKITKYLDEHLRDEAASEVAGEDHQEYVMRVTHQLYKDYDIKPAWPKYIVRRPAPEQGFAKVKKDDL